MLLLRLQLNIILGDNWNVMEYIEYWADAGRDNCITNDAPQYIKKHSEMNRRLDKYYKECDSLGVQYLGDEMLNVYHDRIFTKNMWK